MVLTKSLEKKNNKKYGPSVGNRTFRIRLGKNQIHENYLKTGCGATFNLRVQRVFSRND